MSRRSGSISGSFHMDSMELNLPQDGELGFVITWRDEIAKIRIVISAITQSVKLSGLTKAGEFWCIPITIGVSLALMHYKLSFRRI